MANICILNLSTWKVWSQTTSSLCVLGSTSNSTFCLDSVKKRLLVSY
ncbi:hypothetical protein BRC2024_OFSGVTRC_CDS_0114 [Acinetobacter phage vB_AbaM_Rocket]